MPISKQLNYWIAETGSWQSFVDFKLLEDERASYSFIADYDDLYISLMSYAIEIIKSEVLPNRNTDALSIAKGLEIFSLIGKREYYQGVHQSNNMLYAAGLYYLANYSASAWILSKVYPSAVYNDEIDDFISSFLKRDLRIENPYSNILLNYFETGRKAFIDILLKRIKRDKTTAFNNNVNLYFSFLLAESICLKFKKDNIWSDLLTVFNNRERWSDFVKYNILKPVPVWSFFPSQKLAIEKKVLTGSTFSLQMPTSSGKTSICELIIYDEFKSNRNCRILYLAPYRALASELKHTLAFNVGRLGISSKTIYGGNLPTVEERSSIEDVNLLIATPEKFMAMEDIIADLSGTFNTIICDEGHLLDDESRGLDYELLLSRLKGNKEHVMRFIFVSAIIPNISVINSWLGGTDDSLISSTYRPTELEYAFLIPMDKIKGFFLDVNPNQKRPYNYQLYKYLTSTELEIPNRGKKKKYISSKKGISVATALKATHSGTVALFAPHKRGKSGVEGLAEETIYQLSIYPNISLLKYSDKHHIIILAEYFGLIFGESYLLTQCSLYGILYHHGDFPQSIREIIEDSVRQNKVRLIICTNTLSEGVNLPIKTIIVHSTERYNASSKSWETLKIRDIKNLVGRAGRAGSETKGMIIVPHEKDFSRIKELIQNKNIEPVKGQLYSIINLITNYLEQKRLKISAEVLDSLSEELQGLLDSIDISIIDLLGEEIAPEELFDKVSELISQTLSYYQANSNEKKTLNNIFQLRTDKLRPIVEKGEYPILKNSGANIRLYEDVVAHFNFEDGMWIKSFNALDEEWFEYIFDKVIFQLERFQFALSEFNRINSCKLDELDIKLIIRLWMSGKWYVTICVELDLEMHQVLRFINGFIGFNIQTIVSVIIRLKELKSVDYLMPTQIVNWSSYLQHGIDSQLKLDLIEMGLNDRVGVLLLSDYLLKQKYVHLDYDSLKIYLLQNGDKIVNEIQADMPRISVDILKKCLSHLRITNIQ